MSPKPHGSIQSCLSLEGFLEPERQLVGGSAYRGRPAGEDACHSQRTSALQLDVGREETAKPEGAEGLANEVPAHVTQLCQKEAWDPGRFLPCLQNQPGFKRT